MKCIGLCMYFIVLISLVGVNATTISHTKKLLGKISSHEHVTHTFVKTENGRKRAIMLGTRQCGGKNYDNEESDNTKNSGNVFTSNNQLAYGTKLNSRYGTSQEANRYGVTGVEKSAGYKRSTEERKAGYKRSTESEEELANTRYKDTQDLTPNMLRATGGVKSEEELANGQSIYSTLGSSDPLSRRSDPFSRRSGTVSRRFEPFSRSSGSFSRRISSQRGNSQLHTRASDPTEYISRASGESSKTVICNQIK